MVSRKMKCAISLVTVVLAAATIPVLAEKKPDGAQYLKEARVSLKDAWAIAQKIYPGTIVGEELEKEKGGSGLCYSFDIKSGSATHEVSVDAKDGYVVLGNLV